MSVSINDQILTKLKTLSSNKSKSESASSDLNLQTMDWMSLLVSQLQNQDMYNTTDSSEFTNQMAQYSMIQAMNDMTSVSEDIYASNYTSYATSLVGKEVTVASLDKDKKLVSETGTVTGVTLFEDEPKVYIGDKGYTLSEIMVVGKVETSTAPTAAETAAAEAAAAAAKIAAEAAAAKTAAEGTGTE